MPVALVVCRRSTCSHWLVSNTFDDQPPGLPPSDLKCNLAWCLPWAVSNSDEAVICGSTIAPLSIPSGTGHTA